MTVSRLLGQTLLFALLSLALVRGVSPRAHAQAGAPQAISALDLATGWLFALKRGDARVLDRTSTYPFELRILNAPCACKGGKARDAAELAQLLAELTKSEDVKAIEVTSGDAKEVTKGALPHWAERWGKRVPKGARLVAVESSGGEVYTLGFVLVITNDRVRSVWLNAMTDGGA